MVYLEKFVSVILVLAIVWDLFVSWGYCMLEICVRISYLGIQNRLVYGVGVIRVF